MWCKTSTAAALRGLPSSPDAIVFSHIPVSQATEDDGAVLWWEEIREGVCRANQDMVAARRSECSPWCGCWLLTLLARVLLQGWGVRRG